MSGARKHADWHGLRKRIVESRDVVGLAAVLLAFCREHAPEYNMAQNDPLSNNAFQAIYDDTCSILDQDPLDERLTRSQLAEIIDLLQTQDQVPLVVCAHAVAFALDDCLFHVFSGVFTDLGCYKLQRDFPYPIGQPEYKDLQQFGLISRPWNLPRRPDELPHLRLAEPSVERFSVVFDFRAADHLASLSPWPRRIATCHPNITDSELTPPQPDAFGRFFGIGPLDPQRQAAIAVDLLKLAIREEAEVVVLPELSVCDEVLAALNDVFLSESLPKLLVVGSRHYADQEGRHNEAVGWLRGYRGAIRHRKIWPYQFREGDRDCVEDIHRESLPRVILYSTGSWSLTLLICRDLLDAQLVNLLGRLGVSLVLVPSMSPKVGSFEDAVSSIVWQTQAFLALANNPAEWGTAMRDEEDLPGPSGRTRAIRQTPGPPNPGGAVASGVFGQPFEGRTAISLFPPAGNRPPGIFVLDPRHGVRDPTWHPATGRY